jgi:hypothetical protein
MSIPVSCGQCGWKAAVKDELAGKKGKCPTCGEPIIVPSAAPADDVEAAAAAALADGDDDPAPPPPPAYVPPEAPRVDRPAAKPVDRPRTSPAGKVEFRVKERARGPRGIALGAAATPGLLMMGGAALWFAVGYFALNRIYIYPPFLFVFGLIAFFHGLATRNEAP